MESVTAGQATRRRLSGVATVLIVLVLGGVVTGTAAFAMDRGQRRLATQAMDRTIDDVSEVIDDHVGHYADALTDLSAGISAQENLTYSDFVAMTASLDRRRLPGASGVGFVVPAFDREVAATQAYWRARGAPGLHLYRTGTDIQHEFVIFARSFTGGSPAPGRDLTGIPQVEDALRISWETQGVTVGPAHVLLSDRTLPAERRQMSFTVAAPVLGRPGTAESRTVKGWITMGVHGDDFLSQTLQNQVKGAIQMSLTDPSGGNATVIAAVTGGTAMDAPGLDRDRVLVVGQHTWRLSMRPTTNLLSSNDRRSTQLLLINGTVVTLLLATLIGVLAGTRARAMDRVDEATAALRKDIERREALEHELHRLAFHDPLTGLANRSLFYDRVDQALRSHARDGRLFAVFFIDLDGFKQVNDELGHSAGDTVLREVAHRLRGCLRDSDTVARFGGDEFAVIVERLASRDAVHVTAERIVDAVQRPVDVGRCEATVTASVGVALNRAGDTGDDILREADLAMYSAKTTGKSRHVLAGH